jgi:hypothetical protein
MLIRAVVLEHGVLPVRSACGFRFVSSTCAGTRESSRCDDEVAYGPQQNLKSRSSCSSRPPDSHTLTGTGVGQDCSGFEDLCACVQASPGIGENVPRFPRGGRRASVHSRGSGCLTSSIILIFMVDGTFRHLVSRAIRVSMK